MRVRHILAVALTAADRVLAGLTSLALVGVVALNAYEILLRALAGVSLTWLYETNLLLANYIYFLGICLVYHRQRDITVDLVPDLFRGRARRLYRAGLNAVVIAVFAAIFYYSSGLIVQQAPYRTMGVGYPNLIFTLPVALGAVIMALSTLRHTLDLFARRGAGADEPRTGGGAA
ncbi:MAG: TRAP transporter small permease [Proteobacteria bacterium]|nr:TRAP transporter small permease [Pseudomonadota bacterium]